MSYTHNKYVLQHGSTPQLRVSSNDWYVIRETWEGSLMVNQTIMSRHMTEDAARSAKRDLEDNATKSAAVTLGRRGGQSTSHAKAEAARRNGQRGGRPRSNKLSRTD